MLAKTLRITTRDVLIGVFAAVALSLAAVALSGLHRAGPDVKELEQTATAHAAWMRARTPSVAAHSLDHATLLSAFTAHKNIDDVEHTHAVYYDADAPAHADMRADTKYAYSSVPECSSATAALPGIVLTLELAAAPDRALTESEWNLALHTFDGPPWRCAMHADGEFTCGEPGSAPALPVAGTTVVQSHLGDLASVCPGGACTLIRPFTHPTNIPAGDAARWVHGVFCPVV